MAQLGLNTPEEPEPRGGTIERGSRGTHDIFKLSREGLSRRLEVYGAKPHTQKCSYG